LNRQLTIQLVILLHIHGRTMSAPMRRAGLLLAKAGSTSSTVAPPAVTTIKTVTIEESKTVQPAKAPLEESMMPWEGWFGRFLQDKMGDKYKPFRDFWTFRPDDVLNLEQNPRPNTKTQITEDGKTAMYRYPSPGSQDPVNLPTADKGHIREDPYNVTYYPTDTRRMNNDPALLSPEVEQLKLGFLDENDPRVAEAQSALQAGPGSSPGNKGMFATGKSDYDPTGLRATMSANHVDMQAELQKHLPNHLPTPEWVSKQDEIIAWHEERGLPVPVGGVGMTFIPKEGRVARW